MCQSTACSSVPVCKRMDRLKLGMSYRHKYQRRHIIPGCESHKIVNQCRYSAVVWCREIRAAGANTSGADPHRQLTEAVET